MNLAKLVEDLERWKQEIYEKLFNMFFSLQNRTSASHDEFDRALQTQSLWTLLADWSRFGWERAELLRLTDFMPSLD